MRVHDADTSPAQEYITCQTPPWRYKLDRVKELTSDEGKAFLSIERNRIYYSLVLLRFNLAPTWGGLSV